MSLRTVSPEIKCSSVPCLAQGLFFISSTGNYPTDKITIQIHPCCHSDLGSMEQKMKQVYVNNQ